MIASVPSVAVPSPIAFSRPARVGLEDRYLFTRQLYVLQKAGVPILSSVQALETQVTNGALKKILRTVLEELLQGRTLSQALGKFPDSFDRAMIGMVQAGEAGGLLEEMLRRMATLLEWEIDLRAKINQAIQYPLIVIGTLGVALTVMVIFVLPRFTSFFTSMHLSLPLQTRMIIAFSSFLTHYGWLVGLLLFGAAAGLGAYVRTEPGRLWWDGLLFRLPVIGELIRELLMVRFARLVASLVGTGVPILETLALAQESLNNTQVRLSLTRMQERIKSGQTLSRAMQEDALFPPIVTQMVATGEETGRIDELLQSVADYYDQQVTYAVRKLIMYVEPALLILVGLGVLLMASAVLVPMWDMVKLFKQGH